MSRSFVACIGGLSLLVFPVVGRAFRSPQLQPAPQISDKLMAEAIEEGLAGNALFGSAACVAKPPRGADGAGSARVVLRGPAGRIALSAATAVAARQPWGAVPVEMTAFDVTLDVSFLATAARQVDGVTLAPRLTAIALSRARTVRQAPDITPVNWREVPASSSASPGASAVFRRSDLPPEFDVILRTRAAAGPEVAWSCALTRGGVARIR